MFYNTIESCSISHIIFKLIYLIYIIIYNLFNILKIISHIIFLILKNKFEYFNNLTNMV
jgi:hypothetical protein